MSSSPEPVNMEEFLSQDNLQLQMEELSQTKQIPILNKELLGNLGSSLQEHTLQITPSDLFSHKDSGQTEFSVMFQELLILTW